MRIRKPVERWFEVPGDPDGARIKIRKLSPKELFNIYDQSYEQIISYGEDGEPKFEQVNKKDVDRKLTAIKSIVEWENIFDLDDSPLECNDENIEKAVDEIDGFFNFVRQCMAKLTTELGKEKKAQEKN